MGNVKTMIIIKTKSLIIIKILLLSFALISCSSNNNAKLSEIAEQTDLEIYKKALSLSMNSEHNKAALEFNNINIDHPYSALTAKASIMTAYSLYENNEINKAKIKLESFIEMNPSDELSGYAHYLLAMCYYIQISNHGRDTSLTKKAINHFKIVVSKYPDSKYAKDAKLKIQYSNNLLASKELLIGVFYLTKNFPSAAIKRFKSVIINYKNTNAIPETLYRLCEALLMIGLEGEAKKSNALLVHNFPENKWTVQSNKLFKINNNITENDGMITSIKNYIKVIFD